MLNRFLQRFLSKWPISGTQTRDDAPIQAAKNAAEHSDAAGLWRDVREQLDNQRKPTDAGWIGFLNRMFTERCEEASISPGPVLARNNCSISTERWPPTKLRREAVLHHRREEPRTAKRPVFVRYEGKLLLIDGNNRINQWAGGWGVVTCEIIVIEPMVTPAD